MLLILWITKEEIRWDFPFVLFHVLLSALIPNSKGRPAVWCARVPHTGFETQHCLPPAALGSPWKWCNGKTGLGIIGGELQIRWLHFQNLRIPFDINSQDRQTLVQVISTMTWAKSVLSFWEYIWNHNGRVHAENWPGFKGVLLSTMCRLCHWEIWHHRC